mmetsp:Transcript_28338/g.65968  ORF Transcript_28338/g.65968 Transcript_28338/m.65968 type:complete len:110 (+) Transcript_28338:24-353(+)
MQKYTFVREVGTLISDICNINKQIHNESVWPVVLAVRGKRCAALKLHCPWVSYSRPFFAQMAGSDTPPLAVIVDMPKETPPISSSAPGAGMAIRWYLLLKAAGNSQPKK